MSDLDETADDLEIGCHGCGFRTDHEHVASCTVHAHLAAEHRCQARRCRGCGRSVWGWRDVAGDWCESAFQVRKCAQPVGVPLRAGGVE